MFSYTTQSANETFLRIIDLEKTRKVKTVDLSYLISNFTEKYHKILREHKDLDWTFPLLASHTNFSPEWFDIFPMLTRGCELDFIENLKFTPSWFDKHPQFHPSQDALEEYDLSAHSNLELDWMDVSDYKWKPSAISTNQRVTIEFLRKYPDFNWYWFYLPQLDNFTPEWIVEFPDKDWDYSYIVKHPSITLEFIKQHADKMWGWDFISVNPNFTTEWFDIVHEHHRSRFWFNLCNTPTSNRLGQAKTRRPWNWYMISEISFQLDWMETQPPCGTL